MTDVLLEAEGLTRRFGARVAVDGIDFQARRGEVLGLLGPNGAGKTTTLRMLAGLLAPTTGRVLLAGEDLARDVPAARRVLAYLPEQAALYEEMTVVGYLRFMARAWRTGDADLDATLAELDLTDVRRQVIGTMSRGYRQRVAIAGALVHRPDVLLLDEPTTGLDPRQVVDVRRLFKKLARDRLVLLSTHLLPEASQLCDRVLIVHRGRQVALGAPDALERGAGTRRTRVTVSATGDETRARLAGVEGVTGMRVVTGAAPASLVVESSVDCRAALARAIHDAGWDLLELVQDAADLEDVFLGLTS